jgi:hypothetical protein
LITTVESNIITRGEEKKNRSSLIKSSIGLLRSLSLLQKATTTNVVVGVECCTAEGSN